MKPLWLIAAVLTGVCVTNAAAAQTASDNWTVTSTGAADNPDDADRQVIAQLKAQGSDITKPTDVIFYLYFHTQAQAEALRGAVSALGFTVDIHQVDRPPAWTLVANKTMVPSETAIIDLSHRLTTLATSQQGIYDGWEAALVK